MLPRGMGGPMGVTIILIGLIGLWLFSGLYRVQPNEQGIELVFGRYTGVPTEPGLHWNYPSPIGSVIKPDVTRENRIEVGYRSSGDGSSRSSVQRDVAEESQMITGDENIVDIDFVVFWRIADAGDFCLTFRSLRNAENGRWHRRCAMRLANARSVCPYRRATADREHRRRIFSCSMNMEPFRASGQLLAVDPPKQVMMPLMK